MIDLLLDEMQAHVVEDVLKGEHRGAAVIAGQLGSGKTNVGVTITRRLEAKVILLACPLKSTRVSWIRTFRASGYDGDVFNLTNDERENFDKLRAGEPGLYIIGREYLSGAAAKRGTREPLVNWAKVRTIDVAIFDESHFACNRKSAAFKAWSWVRPKKIKLALSGTWFGNKFENSWAATRALWPTIIDRSFWRWAGNYMTVKYSCPKCFEEFADDSPGLCPKCFERLSSREIVRTPDQEITPGAFAESLPAYYYWEPQLPEDDPAVMEPLQHPIYVELEGKHRREYDRMEEDAIAWLQDNPLEADIPLTKKTRLRQMALGMPSVEETGDFNADGTPKVRVWFEENAVSPKIEAFNEFLDDHPNDNILVGVDSKVFADILKSRLKADVTLWTGDTSRQERERILTEWGITPGKREVLVATIPSMAEGVDGLQHSCHTIAWFNKSTNGILNQQFLARLKRRGQRKRVVEVTLIAVETEDEEDNNRLAKALRSRKASMGKGLR